MARSAPATTPTTPTTTQAATAASFCSSQAATTIQLPPTIQRILSDTNHTGNATTHTEPTIPTTSNQRTPHVPNNISSECEYANQSKQHNDKLPGRPVDKADFVLLRPAR
jgi:hypothetical protein